MTGRNRNGASEAKNGPRLQSDRGILAGDKYNDLFLDYVGTPVASHAKTLGMKVQPRSDVTIPAAYL